MYVLFSGNIESKSKNVRLDNPENCDKCNSPNFLSVPTRSILVMTYIYMYIYIYIYDQT